MPREPLDDRRSEAALVRMRAAVERLRQLAVATPLRAAQNVNDLFQEELSPGDRVAIRIAGFIGSWPFVLVQTVFFGGWAALNVLGWIRHWDPYPFILMSLLLSLQAAYTAPLIMMAQNREIQKDRLMLQEDFETNRRAAEEIRQVLNILEEHGRLIELLAAERWGAGEAPAAAAAPNGRGAAGPQARGEMLESENQR